MSLSEDIQEYVGQKVVLDTLGDLIYLGTLAEVRENGFWLEGADVHDFRDGHAGREGYVWEACLEGLSVNRSRIFVLRSAVCSLSRLDEVVSG